MKLRLDLLDHLTEKDFLEEVVVNNDRYKPEPLFSKTGGGSLLSVPIEQRAKEVSRSTALTQRLKRRARSAGKKSVPQTKP